MKFTSNIKLNHLLSSITFNGKYWRSQHDVLHLSIWYNNEIQVEKNVNLVNALLLLLGLWQKKIMFLVYRCNFLVQFTMLAPITSMCWNLYRSKTPYWLFGQLYKHLCQYNFNKSKSRGCSWFLLAIDFSISAQKKTKKKNLISHRVCASSMIIWIL